MKTRQFLTLALAAALLLAPLAVHADSHEQPAMPLTWLSYIKAQTGMSGQLGMHLAENGAKIYDPMMASGEILTWGVAQPINHHPGDDWTHVEWATFRDWAAVDAFIGNFMAMQGAKAPEQLMEEQEKWYSLVVPGSHHDEIVRHLVVKRGDGGRPGYYTLGWHTAKMGGKVKELFEANAVPVLDKLLADGAIGAYGLATAELHGQRSGTHMFWLAMPNLAAYQTVNKAFEAAEKARGEEEQKALMAQWVETLDLPKHHDRIIAVTHWGTGGGGGDGGGDD